MRHSFEPPPPICTDHSNAFANNTMRVRLPAIIDEVVALNPDYPSSIKQPLTNLRDEVACGAAIRGLNIESAPDHGEWSRAIERQCAIRLAASLPGTMSSGSSLRTYVYRRLIEAVRWHETGRDPFLPKKLEELHSEALWRLIERALELAGSPKAELEQAVALDLWANRIDLSYSASLEQGTDISPDDLLVDDRRRSAGISCRFQVRLTLVSTAVNRCTSWRITPARNWRWTWCSATVCCAM